MKHRLLLLVWFVCAGFEERIDTTRFSVDKKDYNPLEFIREDYDVIVSYPGNAYVASQAGRLSDFTKKLMTAVKGRTPDDTVTCSVCHGTNVNTGHKSNITQSLKERVLKSIQRLILVL